MEILAEIHPPFADYFEQIAKLNSRAPDNGTQSAGALFILRFNFFVSKHLRDSIFGITHL
jgi:hypothetical protein